MSTAIDFAFVKMQGIGNDFVVVDDVVEHRWTGEPTASLAELARKICDRRFGVGADGLILVEAGSDAPFRMRIFNSDGSEPEMCGNGLRCTGRLLRDHGHASADEFAVETLAGTLSVAFEDAERIRVDMGPASFRRGDIGMTGPADDEFIEAYIGEGLRATAVSMGNPHLVVFVDDIDGIDLAARGPALSHQPLFDHGANVHFAQRVDRHSIRQRTWERGAGETLACGTGACAVAAAGFRTGRTDRKVKIRLPGGALEVEYLESAHVLMTGPAEIVFEGIYP